MNKEQFQAYRRNQRICDDSEEGLPNYKPGQEEYFNRYPLQRYPRYDRRCIGQWTLEMYYDHYRKVKAGVKYPFDPKDAMKQLIHLQYRPY